MMEKNYVCWYDYSDRFCPQFFIMPSPNDLNNHAFLLSRERIVCFTNFEDCKSALEKALHELESQDIQLSLKEVYEIMSKREQFRADYVRGGRKSIDALSEKKIIEKKYFYHVGNNQSFKTFLTSL